MPEKTAFIFKQGRKSRLYNDSSLDKFPTEFFYGYIQLRNQGLPIEMIDEEDLNINLKANLFMRTCSHYAYSLFGLHFQTLLCLFNRKNLLKLNQFSTLVVTTNTLGLAFSFMKKLGVLKPKVVFIGMGLSDLTNNIVRKWSLGRLLSAVRTLVISRSELEHLRHTWRSSSNIEFHYIPFGVDHQFWIPKNSPEDSNNSYILTIGNDLNRDYKTLVSAWKSKYPKLKIVTNLPISSENSNIEIISGDWRKQLLSDQQMLELINNAMFVVLPISPTLQPSGQSVCLQSMSCSKAVILSNIKGIWDKELLIDDRNIKLIPCNDSGSLSFTIEYFLSNHDYVNSLGIEANKTVQKHFSVEKMANSIKNHICL